MAGNTEMWNDVYSSGTDWGNAYPSDTLWSYMARLPKNAKVLDLGCGTGRNSLLLASAGYQVTAIDISPIAVSKIARSIQAHGVSLKIICADLRVLEFPDEHFDLVLLYGVLNSINPSDWETTIRRCQRWTVRGGLNLIAYFNKYSSTNSVDGREVVALTEPNYGLKMYEGWTAVRHDSRCTSHSHGNREVHQHVTERIGLQKSLPEHTADIRRVAVVGPTNISKVESISHAGRGVLIDCAATVGALISDLGRQLVCIPDKGVGRAAFLAYSSRSHRLPAHVLAPVDDPQFSGAQRDSWLSTLSFPAHIDRDVTWEDQARVLVSRADLLVSIGMSVGSAMEILWTKWIKRPVYVPLDVSPALPVEICRDLTVFELPTIDSLTDFLTRSIPSSSD